jgi:hypothetical protein
MKLKGMERWDQSMYYNPFNDGLAVWVSREACNRYSWQLGDPLIDFKLVRTGRISAVLVRGILEAIKEVAGDET